MDMHHGIRIQASAERAWHVLGVGFGNICAWSATLSASHHLGAGGRADVPCGCGGRGLLSCVGMTIFASTQPPS